MKLLNELAHKSVAMNEKIKRRKEYKAFSKNCKKDFLC